MATGLQETGDVEVVYSWDKVGVNWPDSIAARRHGRKTTNVIGIKVLLDPIPPSSRPINVKRYDLGLARLHLCDRS